MRKTRIVPIADIGMNPPILSQFEYHLLCLLADDYDTDRICTALKVSAPTVAVGIECLLSELGAATIVGATVKAIRLGIIA